MELDLVEELSGAKAQWNSIKLKTGRIAIAVARPF
jgi:hypothetical protein